MKKTLFKEHSKKHTVIKRKNKEEMEGVRDDASAFIKKQKQIVKAKVNYLNQADVFVRKLHFSPLW